MDTLVLSPKVLGSLWIAMDFLRNKNSANQYFKGIRIQDRGRLEGMQPACASCFGTLAIGWDGYPACLFAASWFGCTLQIEGFFAAGV